MNDFEVGYQRVIHMLVEERSIVERIESDPVRQFDGIELGFLGEDGFDVGLEQRICRQERGAQRTLHRGLGLGLGSCCEAVARLSGVILGFYEHGSSYSFLNMLNSRKGKWWCGGRVVLGGGKGYDRK